MNRAGFFLEMKTDYKINKFAISLGLGGRTNTVTIETLIIKHIKPGSIIMSDQSPTYNNIPNLVDSDGISLNYEHHTINPSVEFVNGWVHTQTIDRLWDKL